MAAAAASNQPEQDKPSQLETPPPQDLQSRLQEVKESLTKEQTEEKRQDFLVTSMETFLDPKEAELLSNLEAVEKPSDELKSFLVTEGSLLATVYKLKTGKDGAMTELIDYFREDTSASVQAYVRALTYITNHQETELGRWFVDEGWGKLQEQSRLIELAVPVVADQLGLPSDGLKTDGPKNEEESKEKDSLKEKLAPYSDGLKLAAVAGAATIGVVALWKWLFGKKSDGSNAEGEGWGKTAFTAGALGLAAAWVTGRALSYDTVRDAFSKDNDSWVNGKIGKALIAFGTFEWGKIPGYLFNEAPTVEEEKRNLRLATTFGVPEGSLESISKMNFKEFMDGKASTLLNLKEQKAADDKVRDQLARYYLDDIRLLPDYESLTVGQVFTLGLKHGVFDRIDPTRLPEDESKKSEQLRAKDRASLADYKKALDDPENQLGVIQEQSALLLDDLDMLDKQVDSWWGDMGIYFEHAFGWDLFTDIDDAREYGDLKLAREQLLATLKDGLEKDHEAFSDEEKSVQGLLAFLKEHPKSTDWSSDEKKEYDALKAKVITARQNVDSAIRYANEQNTQSLVDDAREKYTRQDWEEGGVFILHGLSGFIWPIQAEVQAITEGNSVAYVLVFTQLTGAVAALSEIRWTSPKVVLKAGLEGAVKGPYKVAKYVVYEELFYYRRAFEFQPKELLKKFLSGEMSERDFYRRLADAERYSARYANRGVTSGRIQARVDLIEEFAELKRSATHRTAWLDALRRGESPSGDALSELEKFLTKEEILKLQEFYRLGGPSAAAAREAEELARSVEYEIKGGKWNVYVKGKLVNQASSQEEAAQIADALIEEAKRGGKNLDKIKLRNCWKFAPILMQIVGTADTIRIYSRLSDANTEEEIRTVVAEEASNIFSFLLGAKLTMEVLLKLKKPTDPRQAIALAVLSCLGGLLTALEINEPVEGVIEHFLEGYPNGYEVAAGAADVLASASTLSTVRLNKLLIEKVAQKALASETGQATKKLATEAVSTVSKRVAEAEVVQVSKRMGKEALEIIGKKLAEQVEKRFVLQLAKTCGEDALLFLLKKGGVKTGIAGIAALVDGPVPIGDAVGALFLAWTAKDVYDLSVLIWEGYKLQEELEKRDLNATPSELKVLEPDELIAEWAHIDSSNADVAFEELMKKPHAKIQIQRPGNAGYEVWTIDNGEFGLTLYDIKGERIAGMGSQDMEKIVSAQEQIAAQETEQAA